MTPECQCAPCACSPACNCTAAGKGCSCGPQCRCAERRDSAEPDPRRPSCDCAT